MIEFMAPCCIRFKIKQFFLLIIYCETQLFSAAGAKIFFLFKKEFGFNPIWLVSSDFKDAKFDRMLCTLN